MLVDVLWRNAQKSSVDCHLSVSRVWPIWRPVDTGNSTHRFTNRIRPVAHRLSSKVDVGCVSLNGIRSPTLPQSGCKVCVLKWDVIGKVCVLKWDRHSIYNGRMV